jgi:hypothetical protein
MRILNVCANSATCERLWSVYGNTLTKLRNRLGTKALSSLGELKMHIRDEHVRKEAKTRMKRLFTARAQSAGLTGAPNPVAEAAPVDPTHPDDADVAAAPQHEDTPSGLAEIIGEQTLRVAEDETDQMPVTVCTIIRRPVGLNQLFDFTDTHWVERYEKTARPSFDEELELYELLDLDADGDDNVDVGLDDSIGDLMVG